MDGVLFYPFFQRALLAGLLASLACGIVGTYVVTKRIASISGSLSHAAFGGVGLGYLLGFDPILGAAGFALISSLGLGYAYRRMQGSLDTLLAMVWSLGMALGMFFVALKAGYAPDLMSYLFGSILFVPPRFLWFVAGLDIAVTVTVVLLFKELLSVSFDEEFAAVTGVPVGVLLYVLLALTALTVVILIRVVGAILVIALLTFPPAIARHWSERLVPMMAGATLAAGCCTTLGLFGSYWLSQSFAIKLPTGPLTILIAVLLFVGSSTIAAALKRPRA